MKQCPILGLSFFLAVLLDTVEDFLVLGTINTQMRARLTVFLLLLPFIPLLHA